MDSWAARISAMSDCEETFPGSNSPMYTDSRPSQPANPRPNYMEGHHYTRPAKDEWICGRCTKSYKSKNALFTHMALHFDHPVHKCLNVSNSTTCAEFSSPHKQQAKQHMEKWHSNKQLPYACESCDKRYDSVSNLRHHTDRSHGVVAPQQCQHCNFSMIGRYDQLKRHYQNRHPLVPCSERPLPSGALPADATAIQPAQPAQPAQVAPEPLAGQPAFLDHAVYPSNGIQPNGVVANYVANNPPSPFDTANYGNVALHQQANNVMPAYNAVDYGMLEHGVLPAQQVDNSNLDFLMGNQVAAAPMANNVGNNFHQYDAVNNGTVPFNQQFNDVNYASSNSDVNSNIGWGTGSVLNNPNPYQVGSVLPEHNNQGLEAVAAWTYGESNRAPELAIDPALLSVNTNNTNDMDVDEDDVVVAEDQLAVAQAQQELVAASIVHDEVERVWTQEQHQRYEWIWQGRVVHANFVDDADRDSYNAWIIRKYGQSLKVSSLPEAQNDDPYFNQGPFMGAV